MIQDQLTDYISSQIKLGVSREAIKGALVSAGWVPADVEDTLKKVEGGGMSSAQSGMAAKSAGSVMAGSVVAAKPSDIKVGSPQMIRVSDLVSSSSPSPMTTTSSVTAGAASAKPNLQFGGKISGNNFEAAPVSSGKVAEGGGKKTMIGGIVAAILILIFAGAAWYFYSANAGLATQVSTLTAQSATVTSQVSALKTQLDASSTGFNAQITSLTAANADLALDLSFYAVPAGSSASSTAITVSGLLSGGDGKAPYIITTPRGAKIFVANSTNASTSLALKPLVGDTVQASGMYVPGSDQMTVNSVTSSTAQ